jgi:hypothetical protein
MSDAFEEVRVANPPLRSVEISEPVAAPQPVSVEEMMAAMRPRTDDAPEKQTLPGQRPEETVADCLSRTMPPGWHDLPIGRSTKVKEN